MKTEVLFLTLLMLGSVSMDIAGECNLAGFYLELGCTAIPSPDNSTECPEAFKCPDLHPDPTVCYYRGLPYSNGAQIPQNLVINPCSQACICQVSPEPRFECAAVDCVETFDSDEQQQCIPTFEMDSCCSTGNVCGKDAIASLKTCEVDGQTYKAGQLIEPKNTRKTCICSDLWDGSVDNPAYCKDINCGIEIHYQDKLLDSCAPVFAGNVRGCPIAFQCQSPKTKVIRGINIKNVGSQCVFGNVTLSVGDEVTADEKCTKCACEVPPLVSCTKEYSCDN